MECFYSQESRDHFYISFQSHRIKVKRSIDPHDFQDAPLTTILKKKGWKSLFTLQGFYYPLLVHMFYVNMHTISPGRSFWMAMFGQSFHITFLYSAYLYFMHVFLPLFQRFSLSHLKASFTSNFFIWCPSWASHVYYFGFLLLSLHILFIPCPIVSRFVNRLLDSSTPSYLDNNSILVKSSLTPSPSTKTFPFVVAHSLLGSSSLNCWNILALRLLLHRRSRLLMPCCMRALRPNTIAIRMVP